MKSSFDPAFGLVEIRSLCLAFRNGQGYDVLLYKLRLSSEHC